MLLGPLGKDKPASPSFLRGGRGPDVVVTVVRVVCEAAYDPNRAWTCELVPLLEDRPFCIVFQQGLVELSDYETATKCLQVQ